MPFDLIIWDCDGCLVDSEVIACRVAAQRISALGYAVSTDDFVARFAGKTIASALRAIETETGRPFENQYDYEAMRTECFAAFEQELMATKHVDQALEAFSVPMCVASGSSLPRIAFSLRKTGLDRWLGQHVFSTAVESVGAMKRPLRGKPEPDVFLYAAEEMGANPSDCLVIEDSDHGIHAAKAAGMTVFAYTGAGHVSEAWVQRVNKASPHAIFGDMRELPALVAGWGRA